MPKILCTRHIDDGLVAAATAAGLELERREFIQVIPALRPEDRQGILQLAAQADAVTVFTSKHAVQILAAFLREHDVNPAWKTYAMAQATARALQQYLPGLRLQGTASYGADLADLIAAREQGAMAFFCGNLRRDTLPERLHKQGLAVKEYRIYETRLTPQTLEGAYSGVVFFSPSAVESFFQRNGLDASTPCFAIGDTTAAAIRHHGPNPVVVSPQQDAGIMIETLIEYFRKRPINHANPSE